MRAIHAHDVVPAHDALQKRNVPFFCETCRTGFRLLRRRAQRSATASANAVHCMTAQADNLPVPIPASSRCRRNAGFALLEALIAVMIFSIGVMALVGLQASMARNVTASQMRGEAAMLATQLTGTMWVAGTSLADFAATDNVCLNPAFAGCTSWIARVAELLPQGQGTVVINGSLVDITLAWQMPGDTQRATYALQTSVQRD